VLKAGLGNYSLTLPQERCTWPAMPAQTTHHGHQWPWDGCPSGCPPGCPATLRQQPDYVSERASLLTAVLACCGRDFNGRDYSLCPLLLLLLLLMLLFSSRNLNTQSFSARRWLIARFTYDGKERNLFVDALEDKNARALLLLSRFWVPFCSV